jgi:hypothetical protein
MTELSWSAQLFWMKYLYQGRLRSRAVRVLLAVAIFAIISVTVVGHFGWPNTPYRGEVSKLINGIMLGASGATMLCVIFFVVDATVFGYQLIRSLQADVLGDPSALHLTVGTRWARSTRDDYASRFEVDLRHLDAIILMDFISLRTTVIAKLVYFPFIIIAIMVLARNHLFDNWNMPLGLILVFSVSVAIVVVCAVLLRRGAESVRDRILQLLGDELIRLKGQSEAAAAQVDALIARVRSVRAGAFAPYSQQPIVRAFLLPATTLGGPALLDYLSMANF